MATLLVPMSALLLNTCFGVAIALGIVLSVWQVRLVRYLHDRRPDIWQRFGGTLPIAREMWERHSTRLPLGSWRLTVFIVCGHYAELRDSELSARARPFRLSVIAWLLVWFVGIITFIAVEAFK